MPPSKTDVLEHHGIKGMKWGVRRSQETLDRNAGRETSDEPSRSERDKNLTSKATLRGDVKNARNLSDKTIREKIDRLKLEAELRKLTNENVKPIQSRVERLLIDAGFEVTKKLTVAAMNLMIQKMLVGEKITAADLGAALAPKKK